MSTSAPGIGFVSLVGAGPGDPELLTRRAVDRLVEADLVVYDALVDAGALALAPRARRIFVGKRARRPAVRQEFINSLLVRAARAGLRVVRLKGGDPFVFGRGGEEAIALAAAGVRVEVVPGISSAVAAAALAGIPVTHRGVASAFVVVSGHARHAYHPILSALPPNAVTVVVMMGLAKKAEISALLIGCGWSAATPAAVILGASTAAAAVHTGTLGELATGPAPAGGERPGTIVIGEVVRLRWLLHGSGVAGEEAGPGIGVTDGSKQPEEAWLQAK
jgi:uroporphyrin-III C-methyltransferase/precorrin-2 dehydrogenase/sirohydrochlorin ferrochelatase